MTTPSREEAPERVPAHQPPLELLSAIGEAAEGAVMSELGWAEIGRVVWDLANREPSEGDAVTVVSTAYGQEFYGILNADGNFWTPLAFDSAAAARAHIDAFWSTRHQVEHFMRRAKIVPVRIQLTAIQAPEEKP